MFKRLDWLHVHGDAGGSSSSETSGSSGGGSDAASESDSEASSGPSRSPQKTDSNALCPAKHAGSTAQPLRMAAAAQQHLVPTHPSHAAPVDPQQTSYKKRKLRRQPSSALSRSESESERSDEPDTEFIEQQQKCKQPRHVQPAKQKPGSDAFVSSADDDDIDSDEAAADAAEAAGYDSSSDDGGGAGHSDPGSEDHSDPGSEEEPELQVSEVERNWQEVPLSEAVRGVALRCQPCQALLLNAQAYRQHIASKKHAALKKSWDDPDDVIVFATDAPNKKALRDEGETHMERLARIQRELQGAVPASSAEAVKKSQRKLKRKEQRKGKRERAELKEAATASDGGAIKDAELGKKRSAKKPQKSAAGGTQNKPHDKHKNSSAMRRQQRRAAVRAANEAVA